jgi:hypothetical protein
MPNFFDIKIVTEIGALPISRGQQQSNTHAVLAWKPCPSRVIYFLVLYIRAIEAP